MARKPYPLAPHILNKALKGSTYPWWGRGRGLSDLNLDWKLKFKWNVRLDVMFTNGKYYNMQKYSALLSVNCYLKRFLSKSKASHIVNLGNYHIFRHHQRLRTTTVTDAYWLGFHSKLDFSKNGKYCKFKRCFDSKVVDVAIFNLISFIVIILYTYFNDYNISCLSRERHEKIQEWIYRCAESRVP